mgnify:CR=1 FL=1
MYERWLIIWWQWRFRRYRVAYLRYLAALLKHHSSSQTFKGIFEKELQRYGSHHIRGRLAQLWLHRLHHYGGDLAAAWHGSFSPEVLQVIRVCQHYGSRSLTQAFSFLAYQQEILWNLKKRGLTLLWPAFLALFIVGGALVLIPLLTVPELKRVFSYVPAEHYGMATRALFGTAEWLVQYGYWIPITLLGCVMGVYYSLSRLVGATRLLLDRLEPWNSYRLISAYGLLHILGVLLALEHVPLSLEAAIHRLADTSIPWLRMRLQQVQQRIVQGHTGAGSFATGLLDKEDLWFLIDMAEGHSFAQACMLTAQRLANRIEERLNRLVVMVRWAVLLGAVGALLSMLFWHYRVFEELRQGLINVFV